jgi:hypothetical protein
VDWMGRVALPGTLSTAGRVTGEDLDMLAYKLWRENPGMDQGATGMTGIGAKPPPEQIPSWMAVTG